VIVTLFGYTSTDGRLFDSPAFRLERLLVTLMGEMRQHMAHACTLVYVPHPQHASNRSTILYSRPTTSGFVAIRSLHGWCRIYACRCPRAQWSKLHMNSRRAVRQLLRRSLMR